MAELADLLSKVIRLNRADSTINGIFFNPVFAERMPELLPVLEDAGFKFGNESDMSSGENLVAGWLESPDGNILDLGMVVLTGRGEIEPEGLVRITELLGFVEEHEQ